MVKRYYLSKLLIAILIIVLMMITTSCSQPNDSDFQDFMIISSTNSIYHSKMKTSEIFSDGISVRVLVEGIVDEDIILDKYYRTLYSFRVIDNFGQGDIDSSILFTIWVNGNNFHQIYGQPMPEIGHEYVIYNFIPTTDPDVPLMASYWLDIKEQGGDEYLYPFYLDISDFSSAIKIDNEEENQIYKKGKHSYIIEYLRKNKISMPTFDYKIKLFDFLHEARGIK